jgi:hypothetical protein
MRRLVLRSPTAFTLLYVYFVTKRVRIRRLEAERAA